MQVPHGSPWIAFHVLDQTQSTMSEHRRFWFNRLVNKWWRPSVLWDGWLGDVHFKSHCQDELGMPVPECLHSVVFFTGAKDERWWWQVELQDVQSSCQIVTTIKPTPSLLRDGCPSCRPTNSVTALKGKNDCMTTTNNANAEQLFHRLASLVHDGLFALFQHCLAFQRRLGEPMTSARLRLTATHSHRKHNQTHTHTHTHFLTQILHPFWVTVILWIPW